MRAFETIAFLALALLTAAQTNVSACSSSSQCQPFLIDLTWGLTDASNVFSRKAILINGSFPGPTLRLKFGECVDFTILNNMPNVTGIHFHGIRQLATPWADGVPGVSQYGVKPGENYTYQWTAEESGIYFYHSHYKGQMMDGLYGPIIISPADNATRPFSLISNNSVDIQQMREAEAEVETILTSDWNRFTFNEFWEIQKSANIDDTCTDSFILNGKGSQYCLSIAELTANEAEQVPQILGSASLTAKGCLPANNTIAQGDYTRNLTALPPTAYDVCTPYTGKNLTYEVDPANGWAAISFISPSAFSLFKVTIDGHKLYVYEINGNYIEPQTVDQISVANGDRISCLIKLDQTPADYTIRVASTADATFLLDIEKAPEESLAWAWVLNGETPYNESHDDDVPPLLYQLPSEIPDSDLILRTQYNQWVDLIIKVAGPLAQPHPVHKHANKFYVIGSGVGDFNYSTVAEAQAAGVEFNLDNPPYVDGYTSTPAEEEGAWVVLRYQANTPGAWLLHCHIQTHLSGGMAVAILDAVDQFPAVPFLKFDFIFNF
ncbi:hypothetical protein DV737_g5494, partial [Chaetothyriales sp. CBS 132003]